ncbi:MAG: hypothetical protein GXP09_05220 [Gammaproteobacteria bacterium]|nr:hypothetical protein [Gammaproteobacteria bacterium]
MGQRILRQCTMSERLFYSAFLVLMGVGYLMALVYLYASHSDNDDQAGLSVEDIAANYYGNRSGTDFEASIRGSMGRYLKNPGERHDLVAWLKSGATEQAYRGRIQGIIKNRCVACHRADSSLKVSDLSSFRAVKKLTVVDTGVSIQSIVRLSHIHFFGIGFIIFTVGLVFQRATLRPWLKYTLIVAPFVAVFADIAAWFLTKWDPVFAYTVVIAGACLGFSIGAQIIISLYQMWFSPETSSSCELK